MNDNPQQAAPLTGYARLLPGGGRGIHNAYHHQQGAAAQPPVRQRPDRAAQQDSATTDFHPEGPHEGGGKRGKKRGENMGKYGKIGKTASRPAQNHPR